MDIRITKKRLSENLQYDWIKIILFVVVGIILWELIFTVSAVRLTTGQSFKIYYFPAISPSTTSEVYDFVDKNDVFSYDVIDVNVETLDSQYYGTILSARTSTYEGDIVIIDNVLKYSETEGHETDPLYADSSMKAFIDGYSTIIYDYDRLLADAKEYVDSFKTAGTLDKTKIETNFRKRMKKDNRYRSESEKAVGLLDEIARITKLEAEVADFERLITNYGNTELFVNYVMYSYNYLVKGDADYEESYNESLAEGSKKYGINFGYLEELDSGEKNIDNLFYLSETAKSKDVAMLTFDFKKQQPDLQYETISFINAIIRTYSNLLA